MEKMIRPLRDDYEMKTEGVFRRGKRKEPNAPLE